MESLFKLISVVAEQQGLETLLVDLDSISGTASEWSAVRERNQPLVVTAQLADVKALYEQAELRRITLN
jgi:hypothetical protein